MSSPTTIVVASPKVGFGWSTRGRNHHRIASVRVVFRADGEASETDGGWSFTRSGTWETAHLSLDWKCGNTTHHARLTGSPSTALNSQAATEVCRGCFDLARPRLKVVA